MEEKIKELEMEVFEAKQRAMIAESALIGTRKNLAAELEMEIEGIEDVFEFLEDKDAVKAISERLSRMRKILNRKS